ncbi:MAG: hypothetical protein K0V04_39310 [Deltaproteobacteria bacterium]|nr:hypothetical protein [Deltaproteobacteria bacterium]
MDLGEEEQRGDAQLGQLGRPRRSGDLHPRLAHARQRETLEEPSKKDCMTYCSDKWVSDFGWEGLELGLGG